jgi:hypothetical protein
MDRLGYTSYVVQGGGERRMPGGGMAVTVSRIVVAPVQIGAGL